jgi:hypothetical protein
MTVLARHHRLALVGVALLVGAMSLVIVFGSTFTTFYGPEPGYFHVMGRNISAWVPTGGWILAAILLVAAVYRRGSVRSWLGVAGIFVFVAFFLLAGGFGLTGWKTPTQPPGSLQAESSGGASPNR